MYQIERRDITSGEWLEHMAHSIAYLIDLLEPAGFSFPDLRAMKLPGIKSDYARVVMCFDPSVGIRPCKPMDFGHYETMGYYSIDPEKGKDRPHIVLFERSIRNSAKAFVVAQRAMMPIHPDYSNEVATVTQNLRRLVWTHELMHWAVHHALCCEGKPLKKFYYSNNDEVFFHEGLAQAMLLSCIRHDPYLLELFSWMEGGQPEQYAAYKCLGSDIDRIMEALHFLRRDQIQSFEVLVRAVDFQASRLSDFDEVKMWEAIVKAPVNEILYDDCKVKVESLVKERFPDLAYLLRGTITARRFGL